MQTLTIDGWHPTTSPNGSHGHWATHQKKHDVDRDTAWGAAMQAHWQFVLGRVKLTIVLVYPQRYGRGMDADNAVARCKGVIDGLKTHVRKWGRMNLPIKGFFADDNTDILDLVVRTEIRKGVKATEITLEPAA